jgi:hypothetical protein
MTDHTNLHKELDLIQGVITRMAGNSFMLKGWAVSLAVLVPAITNESLLKNQGLAVYAVLGIVVLCFWYLDAWFLHKEQCYRKLYDAVREKRLAGNDEDQYTMDYRPFEEEVDSVRGIMGSDTLKYFYAVPLAVVLLLVLLNRF